MRRRTTPRTLPRQHLQTDVGCWTTPPHLPSARLVTGGMTFAEHSRMVAFHLMLPSHLSRAHCSRRRFFGRRSGFPLRPRGPPSPPHFRRWTVVSMVLAVDGVTFPPYLAWTSRDFSPIRFALQAPYLARATITFFSGDITHPSTTGQQNARWGGRRHADYLHARNSCLSVRT